MRRLAGSAMIVGLAMLSGTAALACGDKLLAIGRGLRFQRAGAAHEANLVIYTEGPPSGAALTSAKLHTTLRRAVRKLQLVQGGSQLDEALKAGRVDVVLVDFADLARTKLTTPMLVLTGEKASGEFLIEQARLVDTNVDGVVIKGKGHWLMDEAPQEVIPRLVAFINKSQ